MEIVNYFEIKSPFLKNIESLKTPIFKNKDKYFFGDEKNKIGITEENQLEKLKDWIENLKFYETIPSFTSPDLLNLIKAKIPNHALNNKELNYYLKELIKNIERFDLTLIRKLEIAESEDLRKFYANYNSSFILIQFNHSFRSVTNFYFIHALDSLEFHDKNLLKSYQQLFEYVFGVLMKRQLSEYGYDLNKSPFYQSVISPKLRELDNLIARRTGTKVENALQNEVKEPLSFKKLLLNDDLKRKYEEVKNHFIDEFKNYKPKEVAYLLMAMMEQKILKDKKTDYRNAKELIQTIAKELDNPALKYESVNKYFNNRNNWNESLFIDIKDALKNIFQ
ncbi:hypothetical protein GCM10011506_46090 [Marivirga lumbricoides]|uniref:Uncharacterized protein n=1 Tax=Marivirga lumbricoides TaxID=1046115 RepID=A0ABQ1N9B1_9BACT|nr:hypothetical protein GCM10011506_46090 [Marivirga lumbricoides]